MKQVISIADLTTMLNALNSVINIMENEIKHSFYSKEEQKELLKNLQKSTKYKSLLHAKKSLEECNIEIEVPDLKVEE